MQSKQVIGIFVVVLIALFAFGITKFVLYKTSKNSAKNKTGKQNNLILQSGVIGLCLGVGVGTALKDLFSETTILFAGIIGAIIGVIIGVIIYIPRTQNVLCFFHLADACVDKSEFRS